jgi:hypothetical protein
MEGGDVEYILKGTHPGTIPARFGLIWFSGLDVPWVGPFQIVSDILALHSRWLLLLRIEISSIVHCCFSISQNELKF